MRGPAQAGVTDEIPRMQEGVRDWVRQITRQAGNGQDAASPATLVSLLCASAFRPLLMASDATATDIAILSPAGGGALAEAVTGALTELRQHGRSHPPSRDELEKAMARQIQQTLAAGGQRADTLRSEIASVLKQIDAGGTALRAAMEEPDERARADVIGAIGVISSGFSELEFLVADTAKAAAPEDQAAGWTRGCPYRGLLPFNETDAQVFYGRERLAVQLAARVTRGGLVVVTGAPGAGKTSLLRAGLLPILARGQQIPGSGRWLRVVLTPASDPLTELAARLAALGGQDAAEIRDGLAQHPDQAHVTVRQAVLAAAHPEDGHPAPDDRAARLVLIVVQFEQIFTLGTGPEGEEQRRAFVTALCAAATSPAGPGQEPPALVVIAVRGDFWDRCAAYPELADALQDGQFVVGPMTEPELRTAITGPADAAGLDIDPALTGTVLGDLPTMGGDDAADALPLLSEAMALTWDKREGNRLTSHGYDQAGGVSHAVQTGADEVYDALPAARQALARDLFRRLTVVGSDGRLARRPATRDELYTGLKAADQAQADAVLEALVAGRLAVVDDGHAQISQDILLRDWPRLRGWLEEDQPLAAPEPGASQWSESPARSPVPTSSQRDFLQASDGATARSAHRWRRAVAILAVVALVATTAFVVVFLQRNTADQQRDQAIYNQTVAEAAKFGTSNTPLAARLNLAAYRLRPSQDQASSLVGAENTPLSSALSVGTGGVGSVAFSPGGHTLASGTNDGKVRLWDVTDPVHAKQLAKPLTVGIAVFSVAFSPDGHTLISGNYNGTIRLWNVADPRRPQVIPQALGAGSGAVYSVAFRPDGHVLASGDIDGTVRLWNMSDPVHPAQLAPPMTDSGPVLSVAFSPDGHLLASGGDGGTIQLWDVANPAHPRALGRPLAGTGNVFSVAFSPDGRTLAAGGDGGTIRMWDVSKPAHPEPLGRPLAVGSNVESVAFGPAGHTLASGDGDGTIRLWDVADPAHPRPLGLPLTGGTNAVLWVAFSPDGHKLAAGSYDGAVQLWSLPQTVLTGGGAASSVAFSPSGHTLASGSDGGVQLWDVADLAHPRMLGPPLAAGAVDSVAFSPSGRTLASGTKGGAVQLWDVSDPAHPMPLGKPLPAGAVSVDSVAFSADGRTLAAGSNDGSVQLWDVTDPAHPAPLGQPIGTGASIVYSLSFSPTGHTLASGGDDGAVRLWNVADPAHPRMLGRPLTGGVGAVATVAFSPNGRMVASGSFDGTIRLWDATDPARARRFGRPVRTGANIVYSLAFSPNGHALASGGDNGMTRLWDVTEPAHPRPIGRALTGGTGVVYSVAFGRDGHTLASGTYDGTVELWNLNVGYAIQRICATAGNLTPRQWRAYLPQLPYQPSCPR